MGGRVVSAPEVLGDVHLIAESISRGRTLPAAWYTSPDVFELEKQTLWTKSWQYVGVVGQIPEPGSFFTTHAGHIPIVVVRDRAGSIRAFANICAHRGYPLVDTPCGRKSTLQCRYHGWTYALDGSLRAAPRSAQNESFSTEGLRLAPLLVHAVGPLIFVNPDLGARPFDELLGGWAAHLASKHPDLAVLLASPSVTEAVEFDANWKVTMDNGLECYHCPTSHPELAKLLDVRSDQAYVEHELWALYGPPLRPGGYENGAYQVADGASDLEVDFVWPNFNIGFMPGDGATTLNLVLPLGHQRSVFVRQWFFDTAVDQDTRDATVAFWRRVLDEDTQLCAGVQRGLDCGYLPQGDLMVPRTEPGLHHFARLVFASMTGFTVPSVNEVQVPQVVT